MDQVTLIFRQSPSTLWASRVALVAKNPPANAENVKDVGWIAGSRRCPGGGHGNPLIGYHRVRHDWSDLAGTHVHLPSRPFDRLRHPSGFLKNVEIGFNGSVWEKPGNGKMLTHARARTHNEQCEQNRETARATRWLQLLKTCCL